MNLLPIVERELRAESRAPGTYVFRLAGALAALVAISAALLSSSILRAGGATLGRSPTQAGLELFVLLHQMLFGTIWILVPLMTADCISRERREQTLGLLFLTPLRAGEILVAKALAQGLRAGTVCLAIVPMLTLPLLLGGVSWSLMASAFLANASAFVWALTAGVLASTLSRSLLASLAWAALWAAAFLVALGLLNGIAVFELMTRQLGGGPRPLPSPEGLAGLGLLTLWSGGPHQSMLWLGSAVAPARVGIPTAWPIGATFVLVASLAGSVGIAWIAAWRLRRSATAKPPSPRREKLDQELTAPRFAPGLFRRLQQQRLDQNPAGWLEQRRWTSRIGLWVWTGLTALVYAFALAEFTHVRQLLEINGMLVCALLGMLALASASSLRLERDSGVLELLLTTPLQPEELVRGRLGGLWKQFAPALIGWVLMSLLIGTLFGDSHGWLWEEDLLPMVWKAGAATVVLPILGLWASLRVRHLPAAFLAALAAGVFAPFALGYGLTGLAATWGPAWRWLLAVLPYLLLAILILGLRGAIGMRTVLGPWGMLAGLGVIGASALSVLAGEGSGEVLAVVARWMVGDRFGAFDRLPEILTPCLQLGVAGMALRSLVRTLRRRTFAFPRRGGVV